MPFLAVILPLLAAAAPPPDSSAAPINVTGHVWAPFISPMGEPFRSRAPGDDTVAHWFNQADRNHDGAITADEMQADAERFFATLDSNHDGQIDPDELVHYEWEVAPEIQVMSKTRRPAGSPRPQAASDDERPDRGKWRPGHGGEYDSQLGFGGALQGAARYALLSIPEPVAAADADFNRAITQAEFRQAALYRFQLLDKNRQGRLTLAQLEAMLPKLPEPGTKLQRSKDRADTRVGQPLPPGN